jgi:GNAT superfamily N-acetyltransferase
MILPTGSDLERLLELVEARQYEDLFDAVPPEIASREGLVAHRHGGALYLRAGGHDHPMFNRVMAVGLNGGPAAAGSAEAALDRAAKHYREAGMRRWMIQLLPHMESEAFRLAAGERGVIRLRGWAKHLGPARADVPSQTDLRIVTIDGDLAGDERERLSEAWARIVVENFGLPRGFGPWLEKLSDRKGWILYLAMDGDIPVATGALFLVDVGGERFAELNFGSTLADHRGRGAQSALIARRAADARALGARWIATETDEELPDKPNPSYRNLRRLGFPVVYVRANWGPPKPETDDSHTPSPRSER